MPEIIPNVHPIFVHFTVALLSLSVGLHVIGHFFKGPLVDQWRIVARWTLWFGAGITLITGLAGLYAYNTVDHDTASHAAMTVHRNWAVFAIAFFFILAVWSIIKTRQKQNLGIVFIAAMVIAGGVLGSTAWHGGEVVYRYGLGVMSLPKVEGEGHAHKHADGAGHGKSNKSANMTGAMNGDNSNIGTDMNDFEMGTEEDDHSDGDDHEHK